MYSAVLLNRTQAVSACTRSSCVLARHRGAAHAMTRTVGPRSSPAKRRCSPLTPPPSFCAPTSCTGAARTILGAACLEAFMLTFPEFSHRPEHVGKNFVYQLARKLGSGEAMNVPVDQARGAEIGSRFRNIDPLSPQFLSPSLALTRPFSPLLNPPDPSPHRSGRPRTTVIWLMRRSASSRRVRAACSTWAAPSRSAASHSPRRCVLRRSHVVSNFRSHLSGTSRTILLRR